MYTKALGLAGLALCRDASLAAAAAAAYRDARAISAAPGVIADALQDLDALAAADPPACCSRYASLPLVRRDRPSRRISFPLGDAATTVGAFRDPPGAGHSAARRTPPTICTKRARPTIPT